MSIHIEAVNDGWILTDQNGIKTIFPTWVGLMNRLTAIMTNKGKPFNQLP